MGEVSCKSHRSCFFLFSTEAGSKRVWASWELVFCKVGCSGLIQPVARGEIVDFFKYIISWF